ncbi:hypothetical protein CJD36_018335 [Flavipsychrobacter stenotrophus]|uniref:BioF2-like acetyltransferase domain-containing protein n=1 Tax=Flavipsychrobacter stenotrophus TaxID=2077091 RepID=A0A2S7STD1_9BACT|nr:GNAT family N-acetyltransferase [Flavipsychrobacter stenotrophus]PQJ09881.1 hypothetical protein CJD36_018335 [Flavipsychrobacter stenotrophus]
MNKALYKTICEQHPEIPVFSQYWWLDVSCTEWDAAIVTKGSHTQGVWAYPIENKPGVSLIRNPQLTPYLGPKVFFPKDIKAANIDGYEYETIAELLKQVKDAQVWGLAIQPELKQAGLFKNSGLQQSVQQTFLIDVTADEATLRANMKENLRKNIRQAEGEMTITNSPEHLKDLYGYYQHMLTRKSKSAHFSLAYMQRLLDACIEHDAGALWVAKTDDKIHGIVWQVWDSECSYALSLGQNPESDNYKAMSLLLWHGIKEAKRRGQKTFDMEGSMDPGVERFYRSFGGKRALYLILSKNTSRIWKLKQMLRG